MAGQTVDCEKGSQPRRQAVRKGQRRHNESQSFDVGEADPDLSHDVYFGLSHGYWKDPLKLIVFAANNQLTYNGDPTALLNQKQDDSTDAKRKRIWDPLTGKQLRRQKTAEKNERVQQKLKHVPFYRILHVTVARIFAKQPKRDKSFLDSGNKSDLRKISLAAKWTPTAGRFHDKHTFILSSISDILFPTPALHCPDASNREIYLRHIRELCRKQYTSPLRKALQ